MVEKVTGLAQKGLTCCRLANKMRIGIYNEPPGNILGGAEMISAVLAEALQEIGKVDLIHHKQGLNREQLELFSATVLSDVRLRYIRQQRLSANTTHNPWKRYQSTKRQGSHLSEGYDLYINITHGVPEFCHASTGWLIVLFPFFSQPDSWPWKTDKTLYEPAVWKKLRLMYYNWEWSKRFSTYQVKTAISAYTKDWTKRRWNIDCDILYPPIDTRFGQTEKENLILSVGRFTISGHTKRQLEMMSTFCTLAGVHLDRWKYYSIGGLSNLPGDQAYFESVQKAGKDCQATVIANVEHKSVRDLYGRAKIFWHATGYGENDFDSPELNEHFGIVTVEAMAAGCVPVVINKGAQPEIVQHGLNGFLWETLDELAAYTKLLSSDHQLWKKMSGAARMRAQNYDRSRFVARIKELMKENSHR